MKKPFKIIGWILLLFAFASLGFATDNPKVGVPVYLGVFAIILAGVLVYVKKHQKRTPIDPKVKMIIHKTAGVVLMVLALLCPQGFFRRYVDPNLSFMVYFTITVITLVLIALAAQAVSMINSTKAKSGASKLLGYIILIVISAIPAVGMAQYDASYANLGIAYWSALIVASFSWWAFSLYMKKDYE